MQMIVFDVKIMGRTMFHILSITAGVEMCVVDWGGGFNWQNGVDAPISMNLTLLLLLFTVKINLCASKEVELFYGFKCDVRITVRLFSATWRTLCGCRSNNVACTALSCPQSNIVIIKLELRGLEL